MCAGMLCQRHPVQREAPDWEDDLPWPRNFLFLLPHTSSSGSGSGSGGAAGGEESPVATNWLAETRSLSLFLLFITLVYAAMDTFVSPPGTGGIFLQCFVPYAQLCVIVGLTRDNSEGNSVYRLLTAPVSLWLGKLSMTIYLVHLILIFSLCWWVYGHSLTWCNNMDPDIDCDAFNKARQLPVWGIPAVIAATLLLSPAIFAFVEEPMRKLMQKKKK